MSRSSRLFGIDLAYVIATLMCVAISYFFVVGDRLHFLNHVHYFPLVDIFPALFFFLNGMTITLSMRDNHTSQRKLIAFNTRKGTILLLLGLAFATLWSLNILVVCGVFYILASYVARFNTVILRVFVVFCAVMTIVLISFTEVHTSVRYQGFNLEGSGLYDLASFFLFNGYYSILPWIVFFLAGILHGRGQVHVRGMLSPNNLLAMLWILISFVVQYFCLTVYQDKEELFAGKYFPLHVKVFIPAFIVMGLGSCVLLTNSCVYLLQKLEKNRFTVWIQEISSLKYSILLIHLVLGVIVIKGFNTNFHSRWSITAYSIAMVVLVVLLCRLWKKRVNTLGPAEWLMKRLSGSQR
ncbi:MAG: hypothetical protein SH856_10415 [Flavobacteriales bacterium]|nr:hypothetical protein [Flavobacteriales bacterium]